MVESAQANPLRKRMGRYMQRCVLALTLRQLGIKQFSNRVTASSQFDLHLPDLSSVPPDEVGEFIVRTWENEIVLSCFCCGTNMAWCGAAGSN
jgi:hypothetical protein